MVAKKKYFTEEELVELIALTGILPVPMFSFSAYAGGMAARGGSVLTQIIGAVAGGIAIFLPGLLLIYFIYPLWITLRELKE